MNRFTLSLLIFISTLILIIIKPFKRGEAFYAAIFSAAAFMLGLISLKDAYFVLGNIWNAVFSLISIMIISMILDETGFFRWAALTLAYAASARGKRLFVLVIILGALISIFFNNDGTILILTPIVYEMAKELELDYKSMLPFLFACSFIADTASVPLVVSNLANIVNADTLKISFDYYFAKMFIPGITAIAGVTITSLIFFKNAIVEVYPLHGLSDPDEAVKDWGMFNLGFAVLSCVIIGYFIGSRIGIPVSFISFAGALVLVVYSLKKKNIDVKGVLKKAPWSIIVFAFGMYLIVYGLYRNGFNGITSSVLAYIIHKDKLTASVLASLFSTATACTMNNLPSIMIGAFSIKDANTAGIIKEAVSFAAVLGNDVGAKLTPIGSLATIMWMDILKAKGIKISWWYYVKAAFLVIFPVLILSSIVLGLVL